MLKEEQLGLSKAGSNEKIWKRICKFQKATFFECSEKIVLYCEKEKLMDLGSSGSARSQLTSLVRFSLLFFDHPLGEMALACRASALAVRCGTQQRPTLGTSPWLVRGPSLRNEEEN